MSKVDWSLAPSWAKGHALIGVSEYPVWFDETRYEYLLTGLQHYFEDGCTFGKESMSKIEYRDKQWSGPQDGLPPVNSVCEFVSSDTSWGKVKIIAHDDGKVVFKPSGDSYYGATPDHKAVFRPFIDPEQKRETAIREIMDIADVDCRVTAARLVDAGFKREVV